MCWSVEMLNDTVQAEIDALPPDMQAKFLQISGMIREHGLANVGQPHVKHVRGKLWEMRLKGRDGISRALYVTAIGRRVVVVRAFVKKTQEIPEGEINLALKRAQEVL
jgi:phage-related protein